MRIYGPFHALSNPFVMASLGMQALSEGLQVYDRYEQQKQNNFLTASLIEGHPVTEMPGGPIRHLLSKTGLVSPDVTADGSTVGQELLALRGQQAKNIATLGNLANTREKVGPGPFQLGGPLAAAAQQFGGTPSMFAGNTPKEITAQQNERNQELWHSPQFAGQKAAAAEQAKLDTANNPANVAAAVATAGAIGRARGAGSAAGREAVEGSSGVMQRKVAEAAATSAARQHAVDAQRQADLDNTSLADLRTNKSAGGVYIDPKTLKIATGQSGEPQTKHQADLDSRYTFVPNKDVDGPGGLRDAISTINQLDKEIRPLIYNKDGTPNTKLFPDTRGEGSSTAVATLLGRGTKNRTLSRNDPDIQRFQRANLLLIKYIRAAQGRYPNAREFDVNIMPDPGGLALSSTNEGILGRIGHGLPIHEADSWQVAADKFESLRQHILDSFQTGAGINPLTDDGTGDIGDTTNEFLKGAIK